MRRRYDARREAAGNRHLEPAAGRGVGYAPSDASFLADRDEALCARIRDGHRRGARRDRGHREQSGQAHVPQHHRAAGAPGGAAEPHFGPFLQPAGGRHVGGDAADRPRHAARADRVAERHRPQSRVVRPREGGVRASGIRPLEGGQEAAGGDLPQLRAPGCGSVGRG